MASASWPASSLDRDLEQLALALDALELFLGGVDLVGVLGLLLADVAELVALLAGGACCEGHRDERHQGEEHGEADVRRRAEPTLHQG